MFAKHLNVEGFKSIVKLDLPMESINILIGSNGSGKTNLISLFTFLSHLSQGKLRNYVSQEGGAERFFHFGTRHTNIMKFDLRVGINGYHVEFSPNLDDDSLIFNKEYCTIETSPRLYHLYPKKGESGFVSAKSDSEKVKQYTQKYLEQCRVYHFHDTSNQALFKKTNRLINYHYLEKDAANIAPFLYELKHEHRESYQQIVSAIQSVAPFFHDFYLEPSGENIILRWTHTNYEEPFSAHVLSDGTARFICLATLFLQPISKRPDTIIIDEPELGLHPVALNVLADIIHATAKEIQVICSTQSLVFANFFAPEDFIIADVENGVTNFRRLEKGSLEHWLEDYGMGDIWNKNLIGGRPKISI